MCSYSFDKKDCFNRAEILLEKGDIASLRYACLELRQCIEAIAYQKFYTYRKYIPENKLNTWQPKQVFKFLDDIDPFSKEDYIFTIFKQESDSSSNDIILETSHKTLNKKHTNKFYNKLGSYLHTPTLEQQNKYPKNEAAFKDFIVNVIKELRPIVECDFDSDIGMIYKFNCNSCNEIIYLRKDGLKDKSVFTCYKSECQTQHHVRSIYKNGCIDIVPRQLTVECSCSRNNAVNVQSHKDSYSIRCNCGKNILLKKGWNVEEI